MPGILRCGAFWLRICIHGLGRSYVRDRTETRQGGLRLRWQDAGWPTVPTRSSRRVHHLTCRVLDLLINGRIVSHKADPHVRGG